MWWLNNALQEKDAFLGEGDVFALLMGLFLLVVMHSGNYWTVWLLRAFLRVAAVAHCANSAEKRKLFVGQMAHFIFIFPELLMWNAIFDLEQMWAQIGLGTHEQ